MNKEKQPVLCTTLYRKPMQPSNFDGILYQLRYRIFSHGFHLKIRFKRNFKKRPKVIFVKSPNSSPIGLASDDVTTLSNAWQRRKLVLNKGSVPYKSMLGEKSLTGRSSLFLRREVWTVLTTSSQLSASHFKRYWGSDKSGAVFRSIDNLPACFCMGRYLCLEPILPVATPVAGL